MLPILSCNRQCALYAGGLSGTFRCVVGSVWFAEYSRGGQARSQRDNLLQRMISETVDSVQWDDPAHGDWCVNGRELNVWVDAIYLVIGVALERHKTVLEDACWPWPENDAQHIKLAELDTVLKGINLALQWQCKVLHVKTDSVCMHHWVLDTNWENASTYQSSNWNAYQKADEHSKKACGGVWVNCGCGIGSVI